MNEKQEPLSLENQLCFPMYACTRELIKRYDEVLAEIDLTYTQYVTMTVIWEKGPLTVKMLGEVLHLDSGTLTPLLKRLENKGLIVRARLASDERSLLLSPTEKGIALRAQAADVQPQVEDCLILSKKERETLRSILYKFISFHK